MSNTGMSICMFILYIFLSNQVSAENTCLFCKDVLEPTDCDTVAQCGDHEQCFMDAYVTIAGGVRYDLGCRDSLRCNETRTFGKQRSTGLLICSECCKGGVCNRAGCGKSGYLLPRGPLCYNCPQQYDPEDCSKITVCGQDEVCILQKVITGASHRVRYHTGCQIERICLKEMQRYQQFSASLIGKRNIGRCNIQCCNTDLCNNNCTMASYTSSAGKSTLTGPVSTAASVSTPPGISVPTTRSRTSTVSGKYFLTPTGPATSIVSSDNSSVSSKLSESTSTMGTTSSTEGPGSSTVSTTSSTAKTVQTVSQTLSTSNLNSITNSKPCVDTPEIDCNILDTFWNICSNIKSASTCLKHCKFC